MNASALDNDGKLQIIDLRKQYNARCRYLSSSFTYWTDLARHLCWRQRMVIKYGARDLYIQLITYRMHPILILVARVRD